MTPMNNQQNAVGCTIAPPHEVTSISSCVDLNSQSVVLQGTDLCLEFQSTTTVHYHPYILLFLVAGLQIVPPTNFEYG